MDQIKLAFSVGEAAAAAGVGRTLLFDEIRNRRLAARKVGRRTVILREDLEAWLRSRPFARVEQEVLQQGSAS
jgi:excisionase family DNA binding protein